MRSVYDETLHLRLSRELRADLDGIARESGARLSVVARCALNAGLASIRPAGSGGRVAPATPLAAAVA